MDINNQDREKLIVGTWADVYTPDKLPLFLYTKYGKQFEAAINKGFKGDNLKMNIRYTHADMKAVKNIKNNTWVFSAAKTYAQTNTIYQTKKKIKKAAHLLSENGKGILPYKAFRDGYYTSTGTHVAGALELFDTISDTYLKSEYNTVVNMSNAAAFWNRIDKDTDAFPYLKYSAVEDGVICDICQALDGICRPVNDPFWDTSYPPQHYNNCRCTVEQLNDDDGKVDYSTDKQVSEANDKSDAAGRIDMFKHNVGKTHIIFQTEGKGKHPYFDVKPDLIKNNFHLPRYGK